MKNLNAMGNTVKKQKAAPAMKKMEEKKASGSTARFSSLYRPGAMKAQI